MFICERCNKVTKSHEKQHKIVVAARQTFYPEHETTGWEIIKEINACKECVNAIYR